MRKPKLKSTKAGTIYIRKRGIPKGCQYCLEGAKTVLFLNGICQNPQHCWWYCPISKERKGKEYTFADEIQINSKEELIDEINKISAKGMSITGGDPLFPSNLQKTLEYIQYVKWKRGKAFHIHLYTNGENFNELIAQELSQVGLDEIRFNPSFNNRDVIKFALNKGMSVGVEIPVVPEKEYLEKLEELILYCDSIGVNFVNLNEFEFCFPNSVQLKDRGFNLKRGTIASVEKSKEEAIKLIERVSSKVSIKIHFCSIIAKDFWQLKERYHRRAMTIKLPYEHVNEEGLLMFGQIEGSTQSLEEFYYFIQREDHIPDAFIEFKNNTIKLPLKIILNDKFLEYLNKFELKGYIIEMTPFRESEYCQITEKTPLTIFKEEYEFD
ncbi:MAG: radical SAM protein [Candidatus Hermodarchaeota archaeon]